MARCIPSLEISQAFPFGSYCSICLLTSSSFFQETQNCLTYAITGSVKVPATFLCELGNERESFTHGEISLFVIEASELDNSVTQQLTIFQNLLSFQI